MYYHPHLASPLHPVSESCHISSSSILVVRKDAAGTSQGGSSGSSSSTFDASACSYQWFRSTPVSSTSPSATPDGSGYIPLPGATSEAYRVNVTDVGRSLRCCLTHAPTSLSLSATMPKAVSISPALITGACDAMSKKAGYSFHCIVGRGNLSGRMFRICMKLLPSPTLLLYEQKAAERSSRSRWNTQNQTLNRLSNKSTQISSAIDVLDEVAEEHLITTNGIVPKSASVDPSHPNNLELAFNTVGRVYAKGDVKLESPLQLSTSSFEDREKLLLAVACCSVEQGLVAALDPEGEPVSEVLFPDRNNNEINCEFDASWDSDHADEDEDEEEEEEEEEEEDDKRKDYIGDSFNYDFEEEFGGGGGGGYGDSDVDHYNDNDENSSSNSCTEDGSRSRGDDSRSCSSFNDGLDSVQRCRSSSTSSAVDARTKTKMRSLEAEVLSLKTNLMRRHSLSADLEAAASKAEREAYSSQMNVSTLRTELNASHQSIAELEESKRAGELSLEKSKEVARNLKQEVAAQAKTIAELRRAVKAVENERTVQSARVQSLENKISDNNALQEKVIKPNLVAQCAALHY